MGNVPSITSKALCKILEKRGIEVDPCEVLHFVCEGLELPPTITKE